MSFALASSSASSAAGSAAVLVVASVTSSAVYSVAAPSLSEMPMTDGISSLPIPTTTSKVPTSWITVSQDGTVYTVSVPGNLLQTPAPTASPILNPIERRQDTVILSWIGTLDDSPSILPPDNPVTLGDINIPDVTSVAAVSTPTVASDAFADPPHGGDLTNITNIDCKAKCIPGYGAIIWDGFQSFHNGSQWTTNHTVIYCDADCIARIHTTTTDNQQTVPVDAAATNDTNSTGGDEGSDNYYDGEGYAKVPDGSARLVY